MAARALGIMKSEDHQPMGTMKPNSLFHEEELSPQEWCTYATDMLKDQPQDVRSNSTPSKTRVWLHHHTDKVFYPCCLPNND